MAKQRQSPKQRGYLLVRWERWQGTSEYRSAVEPDGHSGSQGHSPQPCRLAERNSVGPYQYQAGLLKKRRIPLCGRRLSSVSWCEVELVQGVWTCLACDSVAPGNITVPSSW
jgi:hypothetical protein